MGKFKTVEDAQQAGDTIKNILTEVARWKQNDREAKCSDYEPTEIEKRLARQYDVTWIRTLHYARDPELAPQAVKVVDRAVVVAEDFIDQYTSTGPQPFPELLEKLGGEVAVDSELGSASIQVTIWCRAPDESTAARLWQHTQQKVVEYGTDRLICVDDLPPDPEHKSELAWEYGYARRDGLELTYTYQDQEHGRYFIRLLKYLRAHNCTIIDYTFEEEEE